MRTIKFRAWNPELNKMSKPFSFGQILNFWDTNFKSLEPDKEIVMQFTGLHDKNGKEIYEGEILYNNDRKEHCIVKYSKEKAMFIVKYLESNDEFPLWESISNLCYSVGNIYENHELLTD